MSLPDRINLVIKDRKWLNEQSEKYHYMHRSVHQKACPFGWAVEFDGSLYRGDDPCGFIVYASVHFTKLKDEFGYEGLPTKWQVLCLSRLWLHDDLPRNSETVVIAKSLKQVQRRWLEVHPPKFPDEPYHIVKIITYADRRYFAGTIYKAANFRFSGSTVSAQRNKTTRGIGMNGATLDRYIYDLKEPNWVYSEWS
jgi:hypothetical protein